MTSFKRGRGRSGTGTWLLAAVAAVAVLFLRFCENGSGRERRGGPAEDPATVLVTGYCNCGECCGWERSWFGFGQPVYNHGKLKGKPKKVGVTACGTIAARGTVAADPKVFGFGTRLEIPGYGPGTVEDVGGAIKGRHIDVWFPSHDEARRWGARRLKVTVLSRPGKKR